jgi:branched-chain amino acid aminotransferase
MSQTTAPLTFEVTRRSDPRPDVVREAVLANPGFGTTFTDHMVTAMWRKGEGWSEGKVAAYGPITLMPSAAVLH